VGGGLRVSRRARRSHARFYLGPGPRGRRPARAQACGRGRRRCGGERTEALTVNCQRLPGSSTAAGDGLGRAPRCDRGATSASAATRQRSVLGPRRHRTRTGLTRLTARAGARRVRPGPLSAVMLGAERHSGRFGRGGLPPSVFGAWYPRSVPAENPVTCGLYARCLGGG
jgi:hypothetical protein